MRLRSIWTILTLRCDGAARLLSDAEDRKLHLDERLALKLHLLICALCRRYRAQLRLLKELIALRPPTMTRSGQTALSDAAKSRIRAKVVEEMKRRGK